MLSINTNLSSLIAQGSMKSSTNKLSQAIERMTTGFKINHAKDNAANYSISTNMTTKIGAYNVAEDNAAMGLDLISTAEGTLSQIEDKLQRLRALQEQASNGTYGEQSLNAINAEVNALVDEINRLYSTAEYNGIKLFGAEGSSPIAIFATPRASSSAGFIQQIARRNTASMTAFSEVDENTALIDGTYSISTAEELAKLATMTNNGLISAGDEFVLADNIDLSAYSNWTPIGNSSIVFSGIFDGNGYVVSGLTTNANFAGLFYQVDGCIKNLGIENAVVISTASAGAAGILTGMLVSSGVVSNCYATGSVTSNGYAAGGLVGLAGGNGSGGVTISSSWTNAEVLCYGGDGVADNVNGNAGGLLGGAFYTSINIDNCYAKGSVEANDVAGGLVGWNQYFDSGDSISNCYSLTELFGGAATADLLYCSQKVLASNVSNCYYLASGANTPIISSESCSATATSKTLIQLEAMLPTLYAATGNDIPETPGATGGSGSGGGTDPDPDTPDGGGSGSGGCTGGAGGTGTNNPSFTPPSYAPDTIILQIGASSDWASQVGVSTKFSLLGVDDLRMIGLDLTTDYLGQIDDMLELVSEKQTHFGATSNRLASVLEEITIQRDNLVSSRSTIRDADIAEVSSHYIQQQILQQASATLLVTANQSPSIALQLI